jgi:DNA damage-binding protein 1
MPRYCFRTDSHMLVSTLNDTKLFRFESRSTISHIEPAANGFMTHLPTLAASNVSKRLPKKASQQSSTYANSSFVVQVTPKGTCLLEFDIGLDEYTRAGELWTPEQQGHGWQGRDIVAASVNASQFVLALSYGRVVVLNLTGDDKFQIST